MKSFKQLPIRTQILVLGLFVVLMVPLIIVFLYYQVSDVIIDQNSQYNNELVSILKQRVSSNYADTTSLMVSIGYDKTVQDFLTEEDGYKRYLLNQNVESLLRVAKNTKTDIIDIIIVNESGKSVSIDGYLKNALEIGSKLNDDGAIYCEGIKKFDSARDTLMFGMNILSNGINTTLGKKLGYIVVILDVNAINKELVKLPRLVSTNIFLIDNQNTLFTSSNPSGLDVKTDILSLVEKNQTPNNLYKIKGKKYIIQANDIQEIGGKIITASPVNNLVREVGRIKNVSLLFVAVMMLIVSIPYTLIIMNIIRPLQKLLHFMNSLKSGNLKTLKSKVNLEGYAEIEIISQEFNIMLDQINSLTHRLIETSSMLYQTELEKQQSKIAYLQSQINPHFLYNTLDSIKGIALVRGVREIYDMTGSLSAIFRYSIKGKDEVALKEELKIIESYLKIIEIRFSNRIKFEKVYQEDTLDVIIPKMILQPVVENAIYHGIEPLVNGGTIKIMTTIDDNRNLIINIADDGVGIDESKLNELREALNSNNFNSSESENKHIGIKNINNRIRLKYGDSFGIDIESSHGTGTKVSIILPNTQNIKLLENV